MVSVTPPPAAPAPSEGPASLPGVPFTSTLMRKMGGTVGQPGYRVTFNTSNVALAGTSAPVFFELIGENGSSGGGSIGPHTWGAWLCFGCEWGAQWCLAADRLRRVVGSWYVEPVQTHHF